MLRFKQYLLEVTLADIFTGTNQAAEDSKNMRSPLRKDYPEGDAGQQQYLDALKTSSVKQREVGNSMTSTASGQAKTLANTQSALQTAKTVADTGLLVGATVVPGVGTALNAGVKAIESGLAASEGEYGEAGAKALEAVLPSAGRLLPAAKGVSTAVKAIANPISTAIEQGAAQSGLVRSAVNLGASALKTITPQLGQQGTALVAGVLPRVGVKVASKEIAGSLKPVVSNALNTAKTLSGDVVNTIAQNMQPTNSKRSVAARPTPNIPRA